MKKRPRLLCLASTISIVATIPIVILISGCGNRETEAVVTRRDITAYVRLTGEVAAPAVADASVLPPYEAPVQKVLVTVGQSVNEGDVLMELSAPSTEAYYQQARQRLQQARTSLAQAQSTYNSQLTGARRELELARTEERRIRQAMQAGESNEDLQYATDRRIRAEQAVIDAEAVVEANMVPYQRQLVNAQQQLQDAQAGRRAATVRTPITGTVLSVNVTAGEVVSPEKKQEVAHVVNLAALKVYAPVRDDDLKNLKPGSPVTLNIEGFPDEKFTGSIRNIYSEKAGFLRGVEHTAVIDFDNQRGMAKPEMDAIADVKVGEAENVLAVPASAIYQTNGKPTVKTRVNNEWTARVVEVGISDGENTAIKSGLEEGDVVLANP